jgi:hypothetical protein
MPNIKLAIAGLLLLTSSTAFSQTVSFNFLTDNWTYDSKGPTTGFVRDTTTSGTQTSKGYIVKGGVTLTFTASFFGGANAGIAYSGATEGSSLTNGTGNPSGFVMTTQNNDSTAIPNGIDTVITGSPAVTSYQRWHFEFSTPVVLNTFIMEDIDNIGASGATSFRDILGAEAFTSITSGVTPTAGSGNINPTYGLGSPTLLATTTLSIGSEQISAVYPTAATGNPSSTANVNASVGFGTTAIRAFSLYAISNSADVHRMSLDGSSFNVIPEPSSFALAMSFLVLGGVALRRRR